MTQLNPAVDQIIKKVIELCCYELATGSFCGVHIGTKHEYDPECRLCKSTSFNDPGIEALMMALDKKGDHFSEAGSALAVTHQGLILYLEDNTVESNYLDYTQLGTYDYSLSLLENLEENSYLRDFAYKYLVELA